MTLLASLRQFASLADVDYSQVDRGQVHVQQGDPSFRQRHWGRQECHDAEQSESQKRRAFGEIQQVEHTVKELVASAERKQHRSRCVIQMHDWISGYIDKFMTGLALQQRSMHVNPVSSDIDGGT